MSPRRSHQSAAGWVISIPAALVSAFLLAPAAGPAQTTFIEVAAASGLGRHVMPNQGFGTGLAAADFDADGDVDFFAPTAGGVPDQLYRNLGDGRFEEVAALLGLASTAQARGALWLDYDADHRLDLLVTSDCYNVDCSGDISSHRLYRQNADGTFTDVTAAAGLLDLGRVPGEHRGGTAAGDVNGDGFVDFVTSFWLGRFHLYLNQGNGTFADVSAASGLDSAVLGHHQSVIQDFDGDGLLDIYTAVDFSENRLWMHQGNDPVSRLPFYLDLAAAAGCDNAMNDMGIALGDFDEDGDPDFYVTNIFRNGLHNVLLRNDFVGSVPAYGEVAAASGVDDGAWGWGTTFLDLDNDGDLDLAETNGWRFRQWRQPPRLYIHQGGQPVIFVDQAASAGLTNDAWGSTLLAFDYDRDGDLDLLKTVQGGALELYQNQLDQTSDRRFLVIRPRMAGRNHWALGAKVSVEAAGRRMNRWITAGISYLGQEPAEAFFGLGSASRADRVTITWPGGDKTVLEDVPAGGVETVLYGEIFTDGFESGGLAVWSVLSPPLPAGSAR